MPLPKVPSSPPKSPMRQKRIDNFFKKPVTPKAKPTKAVDQSEDDDAMAVDEPEEPMPEFVEDDVEEGETEAKTKQQLGADLPPIHEIPKIFDDLVSHIPRIKAVAERVEGRSLRVATMCSGTESPLLALELIQHSIKAQYGVHLGVEHVFSCEIEPFKQAYIDRNFHPPLLFRDVCELGDDEAHTAYGSLAPVPGNVDLLVAGTSCVDYSNLNNHGQDIDANGESGRTFRGMLHWVDKHRPPIVILENVCNAPWDRVVEKFEKINYSATFSRFDTKAYYIPHTRNRVYLIAVQKKKSDLPAKWKNIVTTKLKRPASSSLDAFLLPSDDPRIHQARQKLVAESFNAVDRRTGRTDWAKCESRHQRTRLEEKLGYKRPLTNWDDGGYCSLPDFAWNDWGIGQVERVWDLLDIMVLQSALKDYDPSYKTLVWNLSQNVDRQGRSHLGICPCLTPSMIPYITNRGGPMVGLEALSMQGLPIDKLLLTRESEDQLADLAGNAMSTTVVGATILAALVVAGDLLKTGEDTETYESKLGKEEAVQEMEVDLVPDAELPVEGRITGAENLNTRSLDLSSTTTSSFSVSSLLEDAKRSRRLCVCEGRTDVTTRDLVECKDCDHTSCIKCGGRPEHNVQPLALTSATRLSPLQFAKELKEILPMTLDVSGITSESLKQAREGLSVPEKRWKSWSDAVLRAVQGELRFVELKRQEIWSVIYRSPTALMELLLYSHPHEPPQWRLFAFAEDHEPANADIRTLLQQPVARFICNGNSLTDCDMQLALPAKADIAITIRGAGELVPCWEASLGIIHDDYRDGKVYSQLEISLDAESDRQKFDRTIEGTYSLLDKCGTARNGLHRRQPASDEEGLPMYLLFDPSRTGSMEKDSFVFSTSTKRYEFGESRPVVASLQPIWRQKEVAEEKTFCTISCQWVNIDQGMLKPSEGHVATFADPGQTLNVSPSYSACQSAMALLMCKVPIRGNPGEEWPQDCWREVDKIHERGTFKALAWLLERVRHIGDQFSSWQSVAIPCDHEFGNCERCAPTPPPLEWVRKSGKIVAVEDSTKAGQYERSLKRRPSPFVTQLKFENGEGTVRVGLNATSLVHRALSRLPSFGRTEQPVLSWRLHTNYVPAPALNVPKFALMSNKKDKEHAQPPHFVTPLRKEQLRSLEWMIRQESADAEPFVEEEISEAMLDPMGWRAEGRARRPVHIRGGVLADQVGYGKTAITLGLIDCTRKRVEKEFEKKGRIPGRISLKASLIIVPPHLTRQWNSEVVKFCGKGKYEVLVISTVANLNGMTIEQFQSADIIVIASNIFKSDKYLDNLEVLAASGELPTKEGRHFNVQLEKCNEGLKVQTDRLQDEGANAVMDDMKEGHKRAKAEAEAARTQTKRLKGRSYREAADAAEAAKSKAKVSDSSNLKPSVAQKAAKAPGQSSNGVATTQVSNQATNDTDHKATLTTGGKIVEVVIPKTSPSSKASSVCSPSDNSDDDVPVKRKRKASIKAIPIESEESEEETKPSRPRKKAKVAPKRRKSQEDDDFIVSDTEVASASDHSESDFEASHSDSPPKTSKAKTKSKPRGKRAQPPPSSSEPEDNASDAMDVDSEPQSTAKAKAKPKKAPAKKSADDEAKAKARQSRIDSDPWKLRTPGVRRDWTQMKSPPLEMFHFARKVVDEYTYLDGKVHSLITRLSADRLWVLSGTPPIHDFGALKTISAFLDVHLGVDDDAEGQSAEVKKRKRDQTDAEKFHSFREVHTWEWHANRHALGQTFLDRFVRQNIAEIDEIPYEVHDVDVVLPAAERAIYLELEHHLRALDMTIKRGKKTESDREKRLAKSMGDSKSAEEALLKRCSHFDLDMTEKKPSVKSTENAMKACEFIVRERQQQLDECKEEIMQGTKEGIERESKVKSGNEESLFREWIRQCRAGDVGDQEAADIMNELLKESGAFQAKSRKEEASTEKEKAFKHEHREKTHELRKLTKELRGRLWSLRFFTVVRDIQKSETRRKVEVEQGKEGAAEYFKISCPRCNRTDIPTAEASLLSSCGHMGCRECVQLCAEKEECVFAASGKCQAPARVLNIVKADALGTDDDAHDGKGKRYGKKLEQIVAMIKNKDVIKKDERVLVFVQFPDLMKKVTEAFSDNGIAYLEIKGTASQKSKNLEAFQNNSKERVLLLNVMDESASGANLTSANHAIFLSPLLAPSKEIYDACETQAIGRLVRYGQTKLVHIWRFKTNDTIDEEIYLKREREKMPQPHSM